MIFRKRYSFEFNQSADDLTQTLKDLSRKDILERNELGFESSYSMEFSWDEFILTHKSESFQRASFAPDAYIRLVNLSENLTQVNVKIKFSEITWVFLIFIQLGIIAGCLFGTRAELSWLSKIFLMIGVSALWNFILWLVFISASMSLKKVINRLFEQTI
ncbi:hypothetical protein D3C87_17650 [compost metagenome]